MVHPNLLETSFNPWSPALYNFVFNVQLARRLMILKGEIPWYAMTKDEMMLYGGAVPKEKT